MVTDLVSSERSTILSTLEQKRRSQNRQTVIRKYQVQNNQTVQKTLPKWNSNNNMPSSQKAPPHILILAELCCHIFLITLISHTNHCLISEKAPLPASLRKYARL